MPPALSHCASLVREHDPDRYFCTLFAPAHAREDWFALFAFNHEVAAIPEMVSDDMIGFMRFAWWREALDEIYAGSPVRRHPVVEALGCTVSAHRLPRALFDALLDAREKRFAGEGPEQWEEYFRATSSGLLALCAFAAGMEPAAELESLGIIWGCVGTARMTGDDALRKAAEDRMHALANVPAPFAAFRDTAEFYLKRLATGRRAGREAAFALLLTLCWRALKRRVV